MSPDNLPYVGRIPGASPVFVCAGHGASGWTTGPATAELVAADVAAELGLEATVAADLVVVAAPDGRDDVSRLREACRPGRFSGTNPAGLFT